MLAALGIHLWQSTMVAAVVAVIALALRGNRARVRYGVWFAASLKFLIPFAPIVTLGAGLQSSHSVISLPGVSAVAVIGQPLIEMPLTDPIVPVVPTGATPWAVLYGVWLAGLIGVLAARLRTWRRIRRAIAQGTATDVNGLLPPGLEARTIPGLLEPCVVGTRRPTLLLPSGIEYDLSPDQLRTVIAHELCHVRRHDHVTAAIHMAVEAIFWFHPAVWVIGARLIEERERACDEAVLGATGTPRVYAEAILNVCKRYVTSTSPVVAGVTGAELRARIERILASRIGSALNARRKALLAIAAIAAVAVPLASGARGQAAEPSFDAVSIKLNTSGSQDMAINVPNGTAYNVGNTPLRGTIMRAYQVKNLAGVPAWVDEERYDIAARSGGKPSVDQVSAMLRTMLKERFRMTGHIEPREIEVYALTVARPGHPGLKPVSVDCGAVTAARDAAVSAGSAPPLPAANGAPVCGFTWSAAITSGGIPMSQFAGLLDYVAGRVVVDRTGLTGRYEFTLRFTPPGLPPAGDDRPDFFTAIQEQLGLRLEATRAPVDTFVIDHIERPTPN